MNTKQRTRVPLVLKPRTTATDTMNGVRLVPMAWVNVYETDRVYGGPEEGGWWFTTGEPVDTVPVLGITHDEALAYAAATRNYEWPPAVQAAFDAMDTKWQSSADMYSVNYRGGDFDVRIQDHPARAYPDEYPRYE